MRTSIWRRAGMGCLVVVAACGDDGPSQPIDDIPVDEGIAMCTPSGADASWTFSRLGAGTKPAIAVHSDGTVHALLMNEAEPGWLRYVKLPAGSRAPEALTTVASGYLYGPMELVLDDNDQPIAVYHDHTREDQVLAIRESGGWTQIPMENPGHDGWYNAATIDQSGLLHTASMDPAGFNGRGVMYGFRVDGRWIIEVAAPGSFDYAGGLSIVAPLSGVHIAYFDDQEGVVKITTGNGPGRWDIVTVEPRGSFQEVGRFPDMAYDDETGDMHLVYLARTSASSGSIRYAKGRPGSFTTSEITTIDDFSIGFSGARDIATLALGASGEVIVAVQTMTRLTVFSVGGGTPVTLASFNAGPGVTFGQQTEVALDGQGRIHVTWWQTGESPGTVCYGVSG
jgi:hypothetical protein